MVSGLYHLTRKDYKKEYIRRKGVYDDDLNPPPEDTILPHEMVGYPNILELVLNIRNTTLRKELLNYTEMDFAHISKEIENATNSEKSQLRIGGNVSLILNRISGSQKFFTIDKVGEMMPSKLTIFISCRSLKIQSLKKRG